MENKGEKVVKRLVVTVSLIALLVTGDFYLSGNYDTGNMKKVRITKPANKVEEFLTDKTGKTFINYRYYADPGYSLDYKNQYMEVLVPESKTGYEIIKDKIKSLIK